MDATSEPCGATADELGGALLLDVRRAAAYAASSVRIPGADWRDPSSVAQWAGELPQGAEVVVYCVHGHEVSQSTAQQLREAGFNARFLRGGIDGWQAAGRPLVTKPGG